MNQEIEKSSEPATAFDKILRFMNDGDIVLTSKEEGILKRWIYADKLFIQRKYSTDQIIEKLADNFKVSVFTARNDIYQSQALFAGAIKSNKKYLLHHHAEGIMLFIEKCKLDKSLVGMVPKLMDAYTKAIMALPEELNQDKTPPPIINYILKQGDNITTNISFEAAMEEADLLIAKQKEYTDFDDADDEPEQ